LFIRELDKTASSVSNVILPLSLGNLGLLMADPTIDKTSLHSQIMHTYKWSARVSRVLCFVEFKPVFALVDIESVLIQYVSDSSYSSSPACLMMDCCCVNVSPEHVMSAFL